MTENQTKLFESDIMYIRDWRKALHSPPSYKIGNRTLRFHKHFIWIFLCFGSLIFIFFYIKPASRSSYSGNVNNWILAPSLGTSKTSNEFIYNFTYPLSAPIITNGMQTFRIGIIADMDTESKSKTAKSTWTSVFKKGYLSYSPTKNTVAVSWDAGDPIELASNYALKDRGMELSELVVFNGKLLTFDDRTGFIYEIVNNRAVPWLLLVDGDGQTTKGFKCEWATVKDHVLYVGSMGKEWTSDIGDFENYNPMFVKAVSVNGEVRHLNWVNRFKVIRETVGINWPGYMIHESGMWSPILRKWYFLPRRCSKERYNDTKDEHMGCNILIESEENFTKTKVTEIGELKPTHGFSSFKFIPGSEDNVIVALKTEEVNGKTATYIMAFTLDGKILMEEQKIPTDLKYEGFEFI